jgi:hypothetical protein
VLFVGAKDNGDCAGLDITEQIVQTLMGFGRDGQILPLQNIHVRKVALGGCTLAGTTRGSSEAHVSASSHLRIAAIDLRLLPEYRDDHRRLGLLVGDPIAPLLQPCPTRTSKGAIHRGKRARSGRPGSNLLFRRGQRGIQITNGFRTALPAIMIDQFHDLTAGRRRVIDQRGVEDDTRAASSSGDPPSISANAARRASCTDWEETRSPRASSASLSARASAQPSGAVGEI